MTSTWLSYKVLTAVLALTLAVSLTVAFIQGGGDSTAAVPDANVQLIATTGVQSGQANTPTTMPPEHPAKRQPVPQRRAFSFHYLDVLEWLFSSSRERAPAAPPQGPNTLSF